MKGSKQAKAGYVRIRGTKCVELGGGIGHGVGKLSISMMVTRAAEQFESDKR